MFYSEDVEIIRELIHNKSIDLYDLHLKYRLSPAQVSRSVKNLLNEGVVEIEGETISMTDLGREWIIKNRHALFLDENRIITKSSTMERSAKMINNKTDLNRSVLLFFLRFMLVSDNCTFFSLLMFLTVCNRCLSVIRNKTVFSCSDQIRSAVFFKCPQHKFFVLREEILKKSSLLRLLFHCFCCINRFHCKGVETGIIHTS